MDFIKKNKFTFIAVAVFLFLVIIVALITGFLSPSESKAIYGDRLKGKVEVSTKTKDAIKENLESDGLVAKSSVRVSGRIINIIVTVNDEVDKNAAKGLKDRVVEELSTRQLKYYDVQLFLNKNSESAEFPIIGYKQRNKGQFSWTKDR